MGIAALGIMLYHYTSDRMSAEVFVPWEEWYYTYIRSAFVDVFLLLSGIGLYFSLKKSQDVKKFYGGHRFPKILIPYVVIACPFWIWLSCYTGELTAVDVLRRLSFVAFFDEGNLTFWFVFFICFCYVIFPHLFQLFETAGDRMTEKMRIMTIFCFATVIGLMLQKNEPDFYDAVKIALLRIPSFAYGCLLGKYVYEKRRISPTYWLVLLSSLLIVQLSGDGKLMVIYYANGLFILALIMGFSVGMELISGVKWLWSLICVPCTWLGKISLELYLTHTAVRKAMNTLGYFTYRRRWTLLMWGISLVLSVVVHQLTLLLLRKGKALRLSGREDGH